MVGFKDWRDYNLFMKEYGKYCCQNCTGWDDKKIDRSQFLCMRTLSPVRLGMVKVCDEWQGKDGETLDDFDKSFPLKMSEDTWEKLINIDEKLTFEEIKELCDEKH